jgi:hypothetical protein
MRCDASIVFILSYSNGPFPCLEPDLIASES